MKHILHAGNINYGGQKMNQESATPHISDVLERWANETNYTGSLSELPITQISTAEITYFDENEQFPFQAVDELANLINIANNEETLIIVTTHPIVDITKLDRQYIELFNEHFHEINNWNKQK